MAQGDPWAPPPRASESDPWAPPPRAGATATAEPPPSFSIPDIGAQSQVRAPEPGAERFAAPPQAPQGFDPMAGMEDVVRGAELGAGRAAQFGGEWGRKTFNAIRDAFGTDKTMAEKAREVQRAQKPGLALQAQGLTHPEPTTLAGQILQGGGAAAPILFASALNPALGATALGATAGGSIEDTHARVLQATGSEVKATEAAIAQIPLEALYLAPLGRIMMGAGEGGTLLRKGIEGAISGAVGPGAARVLGEVVGEQVSKEDKADLGAALKRGLVAGGHEAAVNAPVFAFLSAVAGVRPPEVSPEAKADALAGGETPSKITEVGPTKLLGEGEPRPLPEGTVREFRRPAGPQPTGTEPIALGRAPYPQQPDRMSAGEATADLEAAWRQRILDAAQNYADNPSEPARLQLVTAAEPKADRPVEVRPSLIKAAQDPELLAAAQEYGKASERRKLDLKEKLQDNLREFLTPEDIATIASEPKTPAIQGSSEAPPVTKGSGPILSQPAPSVQPEQPAAKPLAIKPEAEGETGAPVAIPGTVAEAGAPKAEPLQGAESKVGVREEIVPQAEPPAAPVEKPAEQPQGEPTSITSIKNATVDAERAARGLEPIETTAARGYESHVWPEAEKRMADDPGLGDRLVAELKAKPRALSDVEDAILLRTKIAARNESQRIDAELLKAQESRDDLAAQALEAQREHVSDKLLAIDEASKHSGTETARGLAARRMMAMEDYSLAALETKARIEAGGRPLTDTERTELKDISERLIAAEKKLAEYQAKGPKPTKAAPRVLSFIDAQADAARARIKARGPRAMAGIDPADFADRVLIGVHYLAHDIAEFGAWSAKMVGEFGEAVKPHLQAIYDAAKEKLAGASKESGRLQAFKTRTKKAIETTKAQTAAGNFEPKPKPKPLVFDSEAIQLKADLEQAKRERDAALARYTQENRTAGKKARDAALATADLFSQLMTSYDLSASLFQGGFLDANHPILSAKSFAQSLRALASERKALEIDTALRNRPRFADGQRAGLELTQLDGPLSKHEEHIRSNWAEKIPLGLGRGVRASNRAFTTFLNVQRALVFDKMAEASPDKSPTALDAFANYVNVATGRGYTPAKMRGAISAAANILWSPRLLVSRFQILAGQPFYRGSAATRKAIAMDYAKSLAALGGVYTLAQLAGAEVEKDPRSAAFGKIKVGDVYVDPMLGLSQVTHLVAEGITGEKKNERGEIIPLRAPIFGEGKGPAYGQPSMADEVWTFLRKKFRPAIGAGLDVLSGKDVIGQPVKPADLPSKLMVPLAFQDVYKAMRDGGVPEAAALGLLSVLGAHVEVHEPKTPKPKKLGRSPHAPHFGR